MLHLLNALGTLRHVQSALLDQKPLTCTCMHQRGSDGPLLPSLCHRAGIHVTPRGWPATTRTLSLRRSNCSNIIFQGVAELPMDQQINIRGFILWPSLKNKQVCKRLHSPTSFTPYSRSVPGSKEKSQNKLHHHHPLSPSLEQRHGNRVGNPVSPVTQAGMS